MAAGKLILTLPDGSSAGIADEDFDSFFLDSDKNLTVIVPYPVDVNTTVPWTLLNLSDGCTLNPDGSSITVMQNTTFSFDVSAGITPVVLHSPCLPTGPGDTSCKSGASFINSTTFTWSRPQQGSYLAVFWAGPSTPTSQAASQKVVDIVVVPNDPVAIFVTNFYRKILGQPLSPTDAWVSALKNHTHTGEDIATAFFINAQEGQNLSNNDFVRLLYELVLMRTPSQGNIDYWVATGMTRQALIDFFTSCGEFVGICSTKLNNIIPYSQTPTYKLTVLNPFQTGGSVTPTSWEGPSGDDATFNVTITPGYTAQPSEGSLSGSTGNVIWTIPNVTLTHDVSISFSTQQQGELINWNSGKYSISFGANQTKTFIGRIAPNSSGTNARGFEIHFSTMGVTVNGSFRMPLKPDGTPYTTRFGTTEFAYANVGNESSVDIIMYVPLDITNSPVIYPGDFVLTLTSSSTGGYGYMRAQVTY